MFRKIKKILSEILRKESNIEKGNIVRLYGSIKKKEEKTYDYFFSYVHCIEEVDFSNPDKSSILKNLKKWNSIKWKSQYSSCQKDISTYTYYKSEQNEYEPNMLWKKIFICDDIEKENYQEFFKEKTVYPRDNIFIVIDKIRLGFRFEAIDDPLVIEHQYFSFKFPEYFYCVLIDGKKTWLHEGNIEKVE
jgi:hypothetical protein